MRSKPVEPFGKTGFFIKSKTKKSKIKKGKGPAGLAARLFYAELTGKIL